MITHPSVDWKEASITINGIPLTFSQAMTVRVAVSDFLMQLSEPEYLADMGPIGVGYKTACGEILEVMRGD